jgi:hypothetical protein
VHDPIALEKTPMACAFNPAAKELPPVAPNKLFDEKLRLKSIAFTPILP